MIKVLNYSQMWEEFQKQGLENHEMDFLCRNNIFPSGSQKLTFFCAYEGEKLIGVCKLKEKGHDSLSNPGFFNWLSFVSVLDGFQNKGVSKLLLNSLFEYIKKEKIDHLLVSGYTKLGFSYLRKEIHSLSKKVEFLVLKDNDKATF